MLFWYVVRAVYIESSAMFVRGGVYRVVKEAMGGTLAKLSVSALLFDYVLTGPISGVSAGQYIVGLLNDVLHRFGSALTLPVNATAAFVAIVITVLLLVAQHAGHPRVERRGAEDHAGRDRDGRPHDRLVRRDAAGARRRPAAAGADCPRTCSFPTMRSGGSRGRSGRRSSSSPS